jgi:hypothetical protein
MVWCLMVVWLGAMAVITTAFDDFKKSMFILRTNRTDKCNPEANISKSFNP